MYPWRRILIPTDFSTASEWVFDDAVRIAGSTGAEIVILHVRMTRPSNPGELRFPADPSLYDYVEKVELEKLRDRVRRANATVPTRLLVIEPFVRRHDFVYGPGLGGNGHALGRQPASKNWF